MIIPFSAANVIVVPNTIYCAINSTKFGQNFNGNANQSDNQRPVVKTVDLCHIKNTRKRKIKEKTRKNELEKKVSNQNYSVQSRLLEYEIRKQIY